MRAALGLSWLRSTFMAAPGPPPGPLWLWKLIGLQSIDWLNHRHGDLDRSMRDIYDN